MATFVSKLIVHSLITTMATTKKDSKEAQKSHELTKSKSSEANGSVKDKNSKSALKADGKKEQEKRPTKKLTSK